MNDFCLSYLWKYRRHFRSDLVSPASARGGSGLFERMDGYDMHASRRPQTARPLRIRENESDAVVGQRSKVRGAFAGQRSLHTRLKLGADLAGQSASDVKCSHEEQKVSLSLETGGEEYKLDQSETVLEREGGSRRPGLDATFAGALAGKRVTDHPRKLQSKVILAPCIGAPPELVDQFGMGVMVPSQSKHARSATKLQQKKDGAGQDMGWWQHLSRNATGRLFKSRLPMAYLLPEAFGEKVWQGTEEDEEIIQFIRDPGAAGAAGSSNSSPKGTLQNIPDRFDLAHLHTETGKTARQQYGTLPAPRSDDAEPRQRDLHQRSKSSEAGEVELLSETNIQRVIEEIPSLCQGRVRVDLGVASLMQKKKNGLKHRVSEARHSSDKVIQGDILRANASAQPFVPKLCQEVRRNFSAVTKHRMALAQTRKKQLEEEAISSVAALVSSRQRRRCEDESTLREVALSRRQANLLISCSVAVATGFMLQSVLAGRSQRELWRRKKWACRKLVKYDLFESSTL